MKICIKGPSVRVGGGLLLDNTGCRLMQRMRTIPGKSPEPQQLGPSNAARGEHHQASRHLPNDDQEAGRWEGFEESHKDRRVSEMRWLAARAPGSRVGRRLMSSRGWWLIFIILPASSILYLPNPTVLCHSSLPRLHRGITRHNLDCSAS